MTESSITQKLELILKNWQERLIDVSKSNPLLGLNRSRAARLEVSDPNFEYLVKNLVDDEAVIKLPFVQKKIKKIKSDQLFEENNSTADKEEYILQEGDINFQYSSLSDLRRKTRKIFDNCRLTLSERGVNTLYLVIGSLEWEDGLMGKSESPLVMIPCEFEYKGPSKALGLKVADDDVVLNPALQYYLRERQEINLPDIPTNNDGQIDLNKDNIGNYLKKIITQVQHNGWTVSNKAWLGIFSFESLAIYQDLKKLNAEAKNNILIQALAHLRNDSIENLALDSDLDSLELVKKIPVPVVETDSSQLRAMTYVSQGANLVIHGPPGTGKSQTITGIIAEALGQKKKVLFVSAKMAALNVVHSRLQALNLGQYCLEAHGVKSGKKKVIDELKRTLELNDELKIASNLDEDIRKLVENRTKLNDYVKNLHDKNNPLGISLFSVYGKYEKLNSIELIKAPLPLKWDDLLKVSSSELEKCKDVLEEISSHHELFNRRSEHPLRGMKLGNIDLATLERIEQKLKKIISFCTEIQSKANQHLFLNLDLKIPDLISSVGFFNSLSTINNLPDKWYKKSIEEYEELIKEIIEIKSLLEEKRQKLNSFYSQTSHPEEKIIEEYNKFKTTYPTWYKKFNLKYFKDKKSCLSLLDKVKGPSISVLYNLSDEAKNILSLNTKLSPKLSRFSFTNLDLIDDVLKSLAEIHHEYEVCTGIKKWTTETGVSLVDNPIFNAAESNVFAKITDILNIYKEDVKKSFEEINHFWPNGFYENIKLEYIPVSEANTVASAVINELTQAGVRDWQMINRLLNNAINNDLLGFIEGLDKKYLIKAPEIFEKRFYSLWISSFTNTKQALSEFTKYSHEDLIHKFKNLDERIRKLILINTVAEPGKIARQVKLANTNFGNSNGVGILRKEMEKKKRLKPLRILFNEIPQILQALKPCFLMSPLSVSTFLKPGAFTFDLVIFDEASQLPTPEAIPSILRAKQVVVAGDSKQLPPTSFFRTNIVDDSDIWEDGETDQLESLLDDCKASIPFFEETDLKWHYRSRDERLINFSNHYYYDNKLTTFPSSKIESKDSGVILEYVEDATWDRGGSRVNRKEARHVAKLIIDHYKKEPQKSLGVVSFNSSQREAIEEALDEELLYNKDLLPFLDSEKEESFFIKSLENVQGDERDVIIISVGYGKSQDGKMTLNFGPINTEGGWRRLNVLITRAKWKTVLVTSIRSAELSSINPENKGALGLKNYIQYAETGFLNEAKEAPKILNEETNDFEDSVRRELELAGFKVDAQVGVGSFRIDLAVRDPKRFGNYAIGIECDGASYHSSNSARDRDILRQEILENMKWKIYRVWSTEWFRNREESVKMLIENVNRAINKKDSSDNPENKNDDSFENDLTTVPPSHRSYGNLYKKSTGRYNREVVMKSIKKYPFENLITNIVSEEGPIHIDLLLERIKELTKVNRVGANIQENFDNALRQAIKDGYVEKKVNDKGFIYEAGKEYKSFRKNTDDNERKLSQVSAVEIQNAVLFLIKEQFGLAYDNASQSVRSIFNISRLDPEESDRIKDIIDDMLEKNIIVKHGPLLNISPKNQS